MTAFLCSALLLGAGALAAQPPSGIPGAPDVPSGVAGLCPGEISDLLSGAALDPGRGGFQLGLLDTSAFRLEDYAVRAEGECGDDGLAEDAELVASTAWRDRESGLTVTVQQTEGARHANVLGNDGTAVFWSKGYSFSVIVGTFGLRTSSSKAAPVDGLPQPGEPAGGPGETPGATPREVLESAIEDLAPSIGLECFYAPATGTWSDIADFGLGDPRGQIPAGFFEGGFSLGYLAQPLSSCGNSAPGPGLQLSFFAFFMTDDGGWLTLEASSLSNGETLVGQIDDFGAAWSNDELRLSVSGHDQDAPLGLAVIKAIATALDPEFSDTCLLHSVELTESELAEHGFSAAQPPTGYAAETVSLTAWLAPEACGKDLSAAERYDLSWSFSGSQGRTIGARASSGPIEDVSPFGNAGLPGTGQSTISWGDGHGRYYSVTGYNAAGDGPVPSRDQLIEVAKSMDATFDAGNPSGVPGT